MLKLCLKLRNDLNRYIFVIFCFQLLTQKDTALKIKSNYESNYFCTISQEIKIKIKVSQNFSDIRQTATVSKVNHRLCMLHTKKQSCQDFIGCCVDFSCRGISVGLRGFV